MSDCIHIPSIYHPLFQWKKWNRYFKYLQEANLIHWYVHIIQHFSALSTSTVIERSIWLALQHWQTSEMIYRVSFTNIYYLFPYSKVQNAFCDKNVVKKQSEVFFTHFKNWKFEISNSKLGVACSRYATQIPNVLLTQKVSSK